MAKAFKCDITGQVAEGEGNSKIEIPVKGGAFSATFYRTVSPTARESGVVCDEVAAQLIKSVQKEFGAPEAPAKK